ncbi:MAG: galactose-1-phosphate uridylyltransferase [Candidatus Sumerlaeia bacterium]
MAVLRLDEWTGEWVIFAPERRFRPMAAAHAGEPGRSTMRDAPERDPNCDFCPGNESATPPETQAWRPPGSAPDSPGWLARAVPNKFPALTRAGGVVLSAPAIEDVQTIGEGQGRTSSRRPEWTAAGGHEVIIECARHNAGFGWNLSEGEAADALRLYRARYLHWASQPGVAQIVIFKNHGAAAGASQPHTHAQLMALPFVPERVGRLMGGMKQTGTALGGCALCRLMADEQMSGERIVAREDGFLVWAAWAGLYPYEIWIAPLAHQSVFGQAGEDEAAALGRVINRLVGRVNRVLDNPAYNLVLVDGPQAAAGSAHVHWHWRFVPKLTQIGGLEIATGTFINLVTPEEAAARLRGS